MGKKLSPIKSIDQLYPTVFAIFGGMGLTWRKLVPALFDLSQDRSLPRDFSIIAVDRVKFNDEKLRRRLHDGVKRFSRNGILKAWIGASSRAISITSWVILSCSGPIRPRGNFAGSWKGNGLAKSAAKNS
jgi:hypothetical protein